MKDRVQRDAELGERFISFAVRIMKVVDALPRTAAGKHVGGQLLRSGTSPAPNYSEAQSAESKRDFVHKLRIALKELRETFVWLEIVKRRELVKPEKLEPLISECNELISILVSSIKTARRNMQFDPAHSAFEPTDS